MSAEAIYMPPVIDKPQLVILHPFAFNPKQT